MKKIIVLVLLVLVSINFIACSGSSGDENNGPETVWKEYTDENFALKHPEDWEIEPDIKSNINDSFFSDSDTTISLLSFGQNAKYFSQNNIDELSQVDTENLPLIILGTYEVNDLSESEWGNMVSNWENIYDQYKSNSSIIVHSETTFETSYSFKNKDAFKIVASGPLKFYGEKNEDMTVDTKINIRYMVDYNKNIIYGAMYFNTPQNYDDSLSLANEIIESLELVDDSSK